jgi:hypothetical protein
MQPSKPSKLREQRLHRERFIWTEEDFKYLKAIPRDAPTPPRVDVTKWKRREARERRTSKPA